MNPLRPPSTVWRKHAIGAEFHYEGHTFRREAERAIMIIPAADTLSFPSRGSPSVGAKLTAKLAAIYAQHEPHILPFVGTAYTQPAPHELRMMVVGINAYFTDHPTAPPPSVHRDWFADGIGKWRYQKAVLKTARVLGKALTAKKMMFADKTYAGTESVYATNAVKVYLPSSLGKRAIQLKDADLKRHVGQWHEELDALAEANVFPHVIVIFSKKEFWETAWKTFHPSHDGPRHGVTDKKDFVALWGDTPHRANRIVRRTQLGIEDVLLVRLRHPAGVGVTGTAEWLLKRDTFRKFAAPRVRGAGA